MKYATTGEFYVTYPNPGSNDAPRNGYVVINPQGEVADNSTSKSEAIEKARLLNEALKPFKKTQKLNKTVRG